MEDKVTAIIVNYNTPELLTDCVNSIRRFYPIMDIIIVDGSETDKTHLSLRDKCTFSMGLKFNSGHGPGMNMGIRACETEYVLLVDSDVTIDKPGVIEAMLEMPPYAYGCGQVVNVNEHGSNVEHESIRYLHPHFALINRRAWEIHPPFINHGAPLLKTMKARPHIRNFPVADYITHKGRGTRALNPEGFKPNNWDKV